MRTTPPPARLMGIMMHRGWSDRALRLTMLGVALGLAPPASAQQATVLGVWRATGVAFESHGHRTLLEARVTPMRDGIHLVVPAEMGLPGGTAFDLAHVAPLVYRATDREGRITTFRVAGGRAELLVTGTDGTGLVTFQFDGHELPR